ncbi:hypothetical protein B0A50_08072 [Salinomyces thailandicus]|uniref:Uncharacterized protein n=1 Tax=Salinomyces thailandicus TaxID=706561 RepID=A0A4U0TKV4_9PEZI|nr:hypothetical protein B0A50_08072 [Salinomyces thailandica]
MASRHSATIPRSSTGLTDDGPARSTTDPPEERRERERSHLHRRFRASTLTGRDSNSSSRHRHLERAKDTVQSAIDLKPPISFDQLLRRDKKNTPHSRRESPDQQQRDVEEWRAQQQIQHEREARQAIRPEDVERARAENAKREEELISSLKEVEHVGMSCTRQLDDTYYAILEKASLLRSAVASLQQLAEESRRMHQQFKDDSEELENDTKENINHFNNFEEQEKTIDELVGKLEGSKQDTDKLNERLESARHRIEAYELKQEAKRSKRRKQWHATWGTLLGVLLVIVAVILLKHRKGVAEHLDAVGRTLAEAGDLVQAGRINWTAELKPAKATFSEDPYLQKLFDEL